MVVEALDTQQSVLLDPQLVRISNQRTADHGRARVELGPVLIDRVDLLGAVERIRAFVASGSPHQVVTVNLDFVKLADRNPGFRYAINAADLAVADGMPLVWISRLKNQALPERVAGVELVGESCALAADNGLGVFLLGAAPGVADAAARTLQARYPGLKIAGVYSPPYGPLSISENDQIIRTIRAAAPSFLFVALGAPRQDLWICEHLERLQVPVAIGVGCVLDLLAGVVSRAPAWMRQSGLEWGYRLFNEPGRLWRRYLVDDLPMLGRLVMSSLRTDATHDTTQVESPAVRAA
jgi:N-acetylglucosaminyldiphosphoundecaprenol N-acetyl-beta-D-mannosaminyltransferase